MVIALVAGVVAFAVIVAVLIIKTRCQKSATTNEEIGIENAPKLHQYVTEDEAVDRIEVREERL